MLNKFTLAKINHWTCQILKFLFLHIQFLCIVVLALVYSSKVCANVWILLGIYKMMGRRKEKATFKWSLTASILAASAFSWACCTAASLATLADSTRLWASALAWPVLSTAALNACNSGNSRRAFSASTLSWFFYLSNLPCDSCSIRFASCLKKKPRN